VAVGNGINSDGFMLLRLYNNVRYSFIATSLLKQLCAGNGRFNSKNAVRRFQKMAVFRIETATWIQK
jgi:hypothetical protein